MQNFINDEKKQIACRYYKRHFRFLAQNYNFILVPEYYKSKSLPENSYNIQTGKVYILKDLYVSTFKSCSYIHDVNKNVLNECFPKNNINTVFSEAIIKHSPKKVIHIDKASNFALKWHDNYWHFTMTALDKIFLMLENGFDGKFFVYNKQYLRELLKLTGIPEERFIFVNPEEHYFVNELHVLDDALNDTVHKELVQNTRNKVLQNLDITDISKYPKRLYIRRLAPYKRLVSNEDEVLKYLKERGFEAIFPDDFSVEEQIKYFYAADIVVAPHGGCSTNALYMRSNTHFVELFGYDYINPCMLDVFKHNDMYYHMVVQNCAFEEIHTTQDSSYTVDLKLLDDILYKYI